MLNQMVVIFLNASLKLKGVPHLLHMWSQQPVVRPQKLAKNCEKQLRVDTVPEEIAGMEIIEVNFDHTITTNSEIKYHLTVFNNINIDWKLKPINSYHSKLKTGGMKPQWRASPLGLWPCKAEDNSETTEKSVHKRQSWWVSLTAYAPKVSYSTVTLFPICSSGTCTKLNLPWR